MCLALRSGTLSWILKTLRKEETRSDTTQDETPFSKEKPALRWDWDSCLTHSMTNWATEAAQLAEFKSPNDHYKAKAEQAFQLDEQVND